VLYILQCAKCLAMSQQEMQWYKGGLYKASLSFHCSIVISNGSIIDKLCHSVHKLHRKIGNCPVNMMRDYGSCECGVLDLHTRMEMSGFADLLV